MDASKQTMLLRLRNALKTTTNLPFPEVKKTTGIFTHTHEHPEILFVENFKKTGGNFIYCESIRECIVSLEQLVAQKGWKHLYCWDKTFQEMFQQHDFRSCRIGKHLDKADVGITTCQYLIARTGSILLHSRHASGRSLSIFPPVHIVIASPKQIVPDLKQAFNGEHFKQWGNPSMMCVTSGASRTADIEKTLVMGAHGPKDLFLFLVET